MRYKNAAVTFLFALSYCVCFYLLNLFLHQRDMVGVLPNEKNLFNWDVTWYHSIVVKGYEYSAEHGANAAFYPLFPWVWKLSHLGPWGISFLNILFFAAGFAFFIDIYKVSFRDKFIWLSLPSLYLVLIPYAEALFVFTCCLSIRSIVSGNKPMTWAGLFLLSLSRPVALVLIPAVFITELIINDRNKWLRSLGYAFVNYAIPLILGTAFFIWYQYHETGVWFAFFKEEKQWGHEFAWPTLPFNSMNGPKLLWANALAMFIGFISLLALIRKGIGWLVKNEYGNDRLLVLSFLYLTAMALQAILFNPVWGTNTTNVYDVHRYVFASPFFWVFLYHFTVKTSYKPVSYLWVLLLSNAFWLLFASYLHIMYLVYFNFCTVIIMLYMLHTDKRLAWPAMAIASLNVYIQVQMFQFFLNGIYPG